MKTLLFALACLTACGGKSPMKTMPPETAAATVLELGEIQVLEGDQVVVKIHADGSTEIGGTRDGAFVFDPGPTLKPDGTVAWGGKTLQVNADGTIVAEGKTLPVVVTADGVELKEPAPAKIELAANGALTFNGNAGDKPVRVEGADTAGKRKAVLALLVLTLTRGEPDDAKEEGSAPATSPNPS